MLNKFPSLVKPTLKTKFHVDFDWFKAQDSNWRQSLYAFLCKEHQAIYADYQDATIVDIVSPETGEVSQGDGMLYTLIHHCAAQPDFLSSEMPLVDSIFKVFLANQNTSLTSEELAEKTGKQAVTILQTIGGLRVYKGIRPVS